MTEQAKREYEFTLIISTQIPEEEGRRILEKYENIFLADGGEIIRKADWGNRKLSFPIKGQYRGHYVHYSHLGFAKNLLEAERLMRIDDHVLRYLSVRAGEDVDAQARRIELTKLDSLVNQQLQQKSEKLDGAEIASL